MGFDVMHISWESVRLFKFLMFISQSYFFIRKSAKPASFTQRKGSIGSLFDVMLNMLLSSHAMSSACSRSAVMIFVFVSHFCSFQPFWSVHSYIAVAPPTPECCKKVI